LTMTAQAASDGIFPCLHDIWIWEYRSQIDQAQINKFSQQGPTLEFTTCYKSRFLKFVPLCSNTLLLCWFQVVVCMCDHKIHTCNGKVISIGCNTGHTAGDFGSHRTCHL
jgi:hypothetical protein